MARPKFPEPYLHEHAPVRNINEVISEQLTLGQRAADWVVARVGSFKSVYSSPPQNADCRQTA
jgi:hypothetical protein